MPLPAADVRDVLRLPEQRDQPLAALAQQSDQKPATVSVVATSTQLSTGSGASPWAAIAPAKPATLTSSVRAASRGSRK